MSLISPVVHIVVFGKDGQILESQKYSNYLATPSPNIQMAAYGNTLINHLIQESYITDKFQLRQVLTGNPYADATRLIGNLAEALVVEYCNKYSDVNRTLARYARFGERDTKSLDNYIAIGTGSKLTEYHFRQHYQPNDTQRDIVWIDKRNNSTQLSCIGGTGNSFKPAGLQIKASNDGIKYILPDISDYHYPILYFDLQDDWWKLKSALQNKNSNAILIHPDEIMYEIKEPLKGYFNLVLRIINQEITIQEIIEYSIDTENTALFAGIVASDINADRTVILHS